MIYGNRTQTGDSLMMTYQGCILRTLESLSQPNRIRYGLWIVERLRPNYVSLAEDMDWEVDATIELIHHALSDRIDDEEPDLDDIVSLVEQLPEGDEGC